MSESVSDWFDFNQKNKPQSNALAGELTFGFLSYFIIINKRLKSKKAFQILECFFAF